MTVGTGIAFAAMCWAVVQLCHLMAAVTRRVTIDEVKDQMDRIEKAFSNFGID